MKRMEDFMRMPKFRFSISELAQLSGVKQKQIEKWRDEIYLDGTRYRKPFSDLDVIRVILIALLNDRGISIKEAHRLIEAVTDPYQLYFDNSITRYAYNKINLRALECMVAWFWFDQQDKLWRYSWVTKRMVNWAWEMGRMDKRDKIEIRSYIDIDSDSCIEVKVYQIVKQYKKRFKLYKEQLKREKKEGARPKEEEGEKRRAPNGQEEIYTEMPESSSKSIAS